MPPGASARTAAAKCQQAASSYLETGLKKTHIAIPDDYQDCVRHLECFSLLAGHKVSVFHDSTADIDVLAHRFADAQALDLTRERTAITAALTWALALSIRYCNCRTRYALRTSGM